MWGPEDLAGPGGAMGAGTISAVVLDLPLELRNNKHNTELTSNSRCRMTIILS
jgi:hypothetical protein